MSQSGLSVPENETMPASGGGFWDSVWGNVSQFGNDVFETVTEKGADLVDGLAEFEYQEWMAENVGSANLQSGTTNTAQTATGQPASNANQSATEQATAFISDNALVIGGVVVGTLALVLLLRR